MTGLDESSFDFWLGEWDCSFEGGRATNTITREYNGRVLTERFEMTSPQAWSGTSLSVYGERQDAWRQTWVDDDGNYWHFVGSLVDGDPSFGTPEPVDEPALYKRMVFSNISHGGFDWRWESSPDGLTWTQNWAIVYSRRSG